tara:strand:+ start:615 stop:2051 length:1437 start_codon:yes stop_codon:yes gene_type:complete
MLSRISAVLLSLMLVFGTAHAQERSSLDSPTCMMWKEAPIYGRLLEGYSHELFIWYWHVYGFSEVRKMPNWVNQQEMFAECFDSKSKGKCGFKANGSIKKALAKNRTDGFDKNPLKDLFQNSPPPEAVRFAMKSLGTCFGNDPSLPSLDDLDMVSGNFAMGTCQSLATSITYNLPNLPPELAAHESWGVALTEYMTKPGQRTPGKACGVVPKAGLPYINAVIEQDKQNKIAYTNRSIAQRIAGLDAHDIAYGLVYRTTSREHKPTRPLPDGAFEWAKDYGAKVENGDPQPPIPKALQQWAVEQPLDKFDAVEDPFASRKRVSPMEITQSIWARRVRSQLNKLAPNEGRIAVTEGCSILWGIAWGDVNFGRRSPQTPGEAEYYRLLTQTPDKWAQTMCNETPVGLFNNAKARYAKRLEEEAYAAANPPPPTAWDKFIAALPEIGSGRPSSIAPHNAQTKRCYDTGQTESGLTSRVCFTN